MPNWAYLLSLFGKEFFVCSVLCSAEIQLYQPSGSLPTSFFSFLPIFAFLV